MDNYDLSTDWKQTMEFYERASSHAQEIRTFLTGLHNKLVFLELTEESIGEEANSLAKFLHANKDFFKSAVACFIAKDIEANLEYLCDFVKLPATLAIFSADDDGNLSGFIGKDRFEFTEEELIVNGDSRTLKDVDQYNFFKDESIQAVANYLASQRTHMLTHDNMIFYYDDKFEAFYFD